MQNERREDISAAQCWTIQLQPAGEDLLEELTRSPKLRGKIYSVRLAQDDSRKTEKQLVDEVRRLGATEVASQCKRLGIEVFESDLLKLADHQYMEGKKSREP